MNLIPNSGFQPFLSVSTQISPCFETFGWKILVIIVPEGTRGQNSDQHRSLKLAAYSAHERIFRIIHKANEGRLKSLAATNTSAAGSDRWHQRRSECGSSPWHMEFLLIMSKTVPISLVLY